MLAYAILPVRKLLVSLTVGIAHAGRAVALWADQHHFGREQGRRLLDSAAFLFSTRPVQPFWKFQESGLWGHRPYQGANPPFGAAIDYYLKAYTPDEVSITIADSSGREVAKLTGSKDPGLNRVMWDLQPKESLRAGSPADPTEYVAAGTYTVTLSASGKTLKTTLRVLEAPK